MVHNEATIAKVREPFKTKYLKRFKLIGFTEAVVKMIL